MSEEKKLKKEDESLHKELDEMTNLLKRNQAEFDNFRKRTESERKELIETANKLLIAKCLPLLDSFELAFQNKDKNEEFIKGMELIFSQFFQILEDEGLKKIDTSDKKFDPYFHEALLTENNEDKDNEVILEDLQNGYLLGDKVLRHSKVKINKK